MKKMLKSEKKKHCCGCTENFYNSNNPYGIEECWNLKDAKIVERKLVHINQVPPWDNSSVETLSCYRKTGFISIEPNRTH